MNELQQVYKATDVGLVRKGNEDNLLVFDKVYAVADGMGGEAAGEVASQLLVNTVQEKLAGREQIREENLCQAIQDANMVIRHYVGEHPGCEGMGTTATLLHIDEQDGQAYWAHVGDSRLYLLRSGTEALAQITRDHSYVEDLVREGTITPEEAKKHPQRNMLTRAVGVKHVEDEAITRILREAVDNPEQALLKAALAAGGTDNITVVVVSLA